MYFKQNYISISLQIIFVTKVEFNFFISKLHRIHFSDNAKKDQNVGLISQTKTKTFP